MQPMAPSAPSPALLASLKDARTTSAQIGALTTYLHPRTVGPGRGSRTLDWLADLAALDDGAPIDRSALRQVVSDLAWAEREHDTGLADDLMVEARGEGTLAVLAGYYVSQRLRFDFRFRPLSDELERWPALRDDAQGAAMAAFAAMGTRSDEARAAADSALRRRDNDAVTRDILLHALWFGTHLPDQPDRIIDLSDEMLSKGEASANVYYRRAFAFRRLGRLDRALRDIDVAMDLLGPGHKDVHQDYVRERELIGTTELVSSTISTMVDAKLEEALTALDQRAKAAEESVSRSLVGMVEVLGLFVALIGFLGAGAVTLFQDQPAWRQVATLVFLLLGSIGFFLTLRFVVGGGFRRRRPDRAP